MTPPEDILDPPATRPRHRSRFATAARQALALGAASLLAVTVITLAGSDPQHRDGGNGAGVDVDDATPSVAVGQALPVEEVDRGATTTTAPVPPSSPSSSTPAPGRAPTPAAPTADQPTAPESPPDPPAESTDTSPTSAGGEPVAVLSPTLRLSGFGGRVAVPLICNVTLGAAGPALSNPALAAVATEIASTCADGAHQGADLLAELDENLAALAAVNPAVVPVLDSLAETLYEASTSDAPFAQFLAQLGELLRFFGGSRAG